MKILTLYYLLSLTALSAFGQADSAFYFPNSPSSFPTKTENLLHRTGTVVMVSRLPVDTLQAGIRYADTTNLTVSVHILSVTIDKTTEYALAFDLVSTNRGMGTPTSTYIDYDELDDLVAAINKLFPLQLEPAARVTYQTRGGLVVGAIGTEKHEVFGILEFQPGYHLENKQPMETLRDVRNVIMSAKKKINDLRASRN